MALKEYQAKRDFRHTREPRGKTRPRPSGSLAFVVQKHAATRLHYDLRLEMDGVLKSWAVPKGFPTQKGDRRLAVQVEDHPIEYGGFEGTIPQGNYGAGTVMVWDHGTYELLGGVPIEALAAGKLHFALKGKKLKGEWALIRLRKTEGDKPQWLLLKSGSDTRPFSACAENRSAISGRTLEQIAKDPAGREWRSDRDSAAAAPSPEPRSRRVRARAPAPKQPAGPSLQALTRNLPAAKPVFLEPMKAQLCQKLPRGDEWLYEIKFDGIRAIAVKDGQSVSLVSRTGKSLTHKFGDVADSIAELPAKQAVLDGEIVAVDSQGRPSFQLLQTWHQPGTKKPPLLYYVFDALNLDGKSLISLPLQHRKSIAQSLLANGPDNLKFSAGIHASSAALIKEMQARGLEGLVAKLKDSKYEPGRRSGAWRKYKWTTEQEFVIGGYTPPKGGRAYFGAILVGYYEGKKLLFAGKVGTGFDEATLAMLVRQFKSIESPQCPFANLPENIPGAYGRGITAGQMRLCTWLRPELVCQVRFSEWTRDHHLRQPVYLGLREDKDPQEVVRERA